MNHEVVRGVVEPQMLQRLPLFRDLTNRQLKEAAELLTLTVVPAGTALMKQGDAGNIIFLVVSGGVKVELQSPAGPSVIHIGGIGEVFGEMAVVEGQTRFATVTTLAESGVCQIEAGAFWTTLWDFPPVPYNLLVLLNNRMRRVTSHSEALKHLPPRERVAGRMIGLFEDVGQSVEENEEALLLPFVLDPKDLASLAGTTLEEVFSLWQEWQSSGVLTQNYSGHFMISSLDLLRA